MPTFLLRPYLQTGDWTPVSGGQLADDNDGTSRYFSNKYQVGTVNFQASTLPWGLNIVVKSIRVRARVASALGAGIYVRVTAGTGKDGRALITSGDGYQFYLYQTSYYEQSTGQKIVQFTQADGDIVVSFQPLNDPSSNTASFSEVYLDVDASYPPSVTLNTPSGTYTTTSSPPFNFTFFDQDGYLQTAYRYLIYTNTQYNATGFIPGVSAATYDSGVIYGSGRTGNLHAVPNGTYRVYFAVAQTVNGQLQWSPWVPQTATNFKDFVVNITPPAAPTIVATADNARARIALAVTGAGAINSSLDVYQLERSFDSGVTWELVRSDLENGYLQNVGGARQWYDYETGNGQSVIYRARTITYDTVGNTLVGAYSSSSSPASWTSTSTWLKVVDRPDLNRTIIVRSFGLERYDTTMGTFQGLDSDDVVVVTGTRRSRPDGTFTVLAQTDAEQDALRAILDIGSPILVQASSRSSDWKNTTKYLQVGDLQVTRPTRAGWSEIRDLTMPYTEIGRPDPSVYLVEFGVNTWQYIDDTYASWTALNAAFSTYGAIRG